MALILSCITIFSVVNQALLLNINIKTNENELNVTKNEDLIWRDSKKTNEVLNDSKNGDVILNFSKAEDVRSLTWNETMDFLKSETNLRLGRFNLTNIISTVNVSQQCKNSLQIFESSLSNWETWAVMMYDATGGLPSGVLDGRMTSFGSFDQCLRIRAPHFQGQYCMLGIQTPLLTKYYVRGKYGPHRNEQYEDTYGKPPEWVSEFMARSGTLLKAWYSFRAICVPSTCSVEDVEALSSEVLKPYGFEVTRRDCQMEKPITWTTHDIVAMSFVGLIAVLCFLGTATDMIRRWLCVNEPNKNPALDCLLAFSVPANSAKMLEGGRSGGSLGCLDGLRVMSFMWIMAEHVVHLFFIQRQAIYRNILDATEGWTGYFRSIFIDAANLAVDTFFVISGFLLVFTTWKKVDKSGGRFNILKFMLQKYMKLTPSLILTIALFMLMYKLGSGPLWNLWIGDYYEQCQEMWWYNLLYINNWNYSRKCLVHTWFLAALMQLHFVGIILLCIGYRWPILGTILSSVVFIIGAIAYPTWLFLEIFYPYPMTRTYYAKDLELASTFYKYFHRTTYPHIGSYMFGMALGYIYLKHKKELPKALKSFGWFLTTLLLVYAACGSYFYPDSKVHSVFYTISFRTIWAAGLCWLIYACCSGQGGVVNSILSWQGFAFLSKISYLLYLLHKIVILGAQASSREAHTYGVLDWVLDVLGYTSMSCIITVMAYVTVELPFGTITTNIFKRN